MTTEPKQITARKYAVSSGHTLATEAGIAVLEAGGNAVDAGVAVGIALGVLHSDLVNVAGVAPIMIRMADTGKVVTIDGLGTWPKAASVEFFEKNYNGEMPEGILRTVIPGAPSSWIIALRDFGTISFGEAAQYAIRYARDGFEVFDLLAEVIADNEERYRATPENQRTYLPDNRPPRVGELFVQADLGRSLQYMADQEAAAGGDRLNGLQAAHDAFYKGDIAHAICDYHEKHSGFMTADDMAEFTARYEDPIAVPFGEYEIYACGAWCQGISLAQAFAALDADHLQSLGHNSTAYIHYLTEVFKLVFADREQWVSDPRFVQVPVDEMLQAAYLKKRLELIQPDKAWPEMPPAGDPINQLATLSGPAGQRPQESGDDASALDTSYGCVIDADGNMFSATPSDTSATTEVIPGTGLCASSRGSQSRGTSTSINCVAPGKRPRLTPNPAIALKDGQPFLTFGTPGGDVQIQAMIQVFANITCFGMDVQSAISAPRFATYSFPSSFAPNDYHPGLLKLETGIDPDTGTALEKFGHRIEWWIKNDWRAGGICAIHVDQNNQKLNAGADPRRAGLAQGE